MKYRIVFILFLAALTACNKEDEVPFVKPKAYLPAYPGSYWTYTNGERVMVNSNYEEHQYQKTVNSTEMSSKKRVPVYDGKYLYEYQISQSSTVFPLKTLLTEKKGSPWQVNLINGQKVMRSTITAGDSVLIAIPGTLDSTKYYNVIQVVEYLEPLTAKAWHLKEYYAKDIGLIKTEIDNPYDTLPAIVEKELLVNGYHINN